jgi:broad specificity polyphosphatase/5'/3'-nucleotidase SurE
MIGNKLKDNRHSRSCTSSNDLRKTRNNIMVNMPHYKTRDSVQCKYISYRRNLKFSTSTKHKPMLQKTYATLAIFQNMINKEEVDCIYCTKNYLKVTPTARQMIQEKKRSPLIMDRYRKENIKPGNIQHG